MKLFKIIGISFGAIIGMGVVAIIVLTILTSDGFAHITDLINEDTDQVVIDENFDFSDSKLNNCRINKVFLQPYIPQNPSDSYDDENETYALELMAYKDGDDESIVTINSVSIEGVSAIKYSPISIKVDKQLQFEEGQIQESQSTLLEEINVNSRDLSKDSKIKVTLSVSSELNGEITNRDLEYIFVTNIRTYLVQM